MLLVLDLSSGSVIVPMNNTLVIVKVLLSAVKVSQPRCYETFSFYLVNIVGLQNAPPGDCNTGDIRLVNGTSPLEGRLEICINNAWGTVCRRSFSSDDAGVACRQLGNITGNNFFIKNLMKIDALTTRSTRECCSYCG